MNFCLKTNVLSKLLNSLILILFQGEGLLVKILDTIIAIREVKVIRMKVEENLILLIY